MPLLLLLLHLLVLVASNCVHFTSGPFIKSTMSQSSETSNATTTAFLLPRIVQAVNTDWTASRALKHTFGTEEGCRPLLPTMQWDLSLLGALTAPQPPSTDFWSGLPDVKSIVNLKDF